MSSQRYEILALVSNGVISAEQGDHLLISLGTRKRRAKLLFWSTVVAILAPCIVLYFHQVEHLRSLLQSMLGELDSLEIFRQVHVAISRAIEAL
jgi:hypothetical protein